MLTFKQQSTTNKYLKSCVTYNTDASMLFSSMLKHILDSGSNYGSAAKRVMHVAAKPLSSFLKCHMKI